MGKTSSAVKQKYNNIVYSQINIRLPKELVQTWEKQLEKDKISKAEFLRSAINEYLLKCEETKIVDKKD